MSVTEFFTRLFRRRGASVAPKAKKTEKQRTGDRGETLACRYLQKKGYRILGRNIRFSHLELDIVAQTDDCTVIVEVKTRKGTEEENLASGYGRASDSVGPEKAEHLYRAAKKYLSGHDTGRPARIDVIEVYLPTRGKPQINHIENAVTRQNMRRKRWR